MAPTRTAKVPATEGCPTSRKSGTQRAAKPAPPPKDRALPKIVPIKRAPSDPGSEPKALVAETPSPAMPAARPPTPTLPEADPLSLVGASAMPTTPPPTEDGADLPTVIPPSLPEDPESALIQPSPIHILAEASSSEPQT